MLALTSVWLALITLGISVAMLVHRPWFNDATVPIVLWLGSPLSMCLAGLVLWAHRKKSSPGPNLMAQRTQCKVAIALALAAAAIVYLLVIRAETVPV